MTDPSEVLAAAEARLRAAVRELGEAEAELGAPTSTAWPVGHDARRRVMYTAIHRCQQALDKLQL